ncbi:MAG: RluA family pseudouridine synthase [Candidatus Aureabacteria bacterium]|nr:RluA family pseudouridine synthase [Candidatus Auribacterota bacterium]
MGGRATKKKGGEVQPGIHAQEGKYLVDEGRDGARLDKFLVDRLEGRSRAEIQRLIEGAHIRLNGRGVKPHHRVRRGDEVEVSFPPPVESSILAEEIPLHVLYDDADLLVVNKPAGMIVHPAGRILSGTLVNALLARCGDLSGIGGELKPGIVHRLDKGTSGCIIVAKNDEAHQSLSNQFARRAVRKEYLALLHGSLPGERGTVEGLIGRHPVERKRMAVCRDRGRSAVTRFEVIERIGGFTLAKIFLQTGRTHQIRVHMAHLGHPVVGDAVYGRRRSRVIGEMGIERPMLHAWRIGFTHPRTGVAVHVEAPLPEDIERVLNCLRAEKQT